MFYIVQENTFRERHYQTLIDNLERWSLPYEVVRIFPFVDKIVAVKDIPEEEYNLDDIPDFVPPTNNVFIFGAVKLSRICRERGWTPGSLLNDNHDFVVYKEHYREHLLNWDSQVIKLTDEIDWKEDEIKFIRPTQDTKAFTGAVFTRHEWEDRKEHNLHNFRNENFNENTLIQVSSLKNIFKEIRFWVVDGKVVTGSTYRVGRDVQYSRQLVDPAAYDFAQQMVDIFQLADAFVIDVCQTDNGWKIVECGCINSAGFYDSDITKMLAAVEDTFNRDREMMRNSGVIDYPPQI